MDCPGQSMDPCLEQAIHGLSRTKHGSMLGAGNAWIVPRPGHSETIHELPACLAWMHALSGQSMNCQLA